MMLPSFWRRGCTFRDGGIGLSSFSSVESFGVEVHLITCFDRWTGCRTIHGFVFLWREERAFPSTCRLFFVARTYFLLFS